MNLTSKTEKICLLFIPLSVQLSTTFTADNCAIAAKDTYRLNGRVLHGHAEAFLALGGRVEVMSEAPQQVAHLVRHVAQGDGVFRNVSGPEATGVALLAAPGAVDALGQPAEEQAGGHLLVEPAESVVVQELLQIGARLQQQAHELVLVADQG